VKWTDTMSTTETPARLVARSACGLLLGALCGCMSSRGLPLLYADPGVRIERPVAGVITYRRGMALQTGDVIQTADGYAVIYFDRGNVVDLRPDTRVALGSITLFFGEMFARIVDVASHGGGQAFTDELTASVEGTQYAVRRAVMSGYGSNSAGNTSVIVRDGHVRCAPRGTGTWPAVVVGPNFVLHVEGPRMLGPPGPIDAAAETQWSEEVERRLLGPRRAVAGTSAWLQPRSRPRPTPPPSPRPAGNMGPS
jgi:hypothetical protein